MNEISRKFNFKADNFLISKINESSLGIKEILLKAIKGIEVSENEGVTLFKANNTQDKKAIFETANFLCRSIKGSKVTFVIGKVD